MFIRDLALAVALPVLVPFAWLSPERSHQSAAGFVPRMILRLLPEAARRKQERIGPTFGIGAAEPFFTNVVTATYFEILQLLRLHAPGGEPPVVALKGKALLEEAYRSGNGVILWVAPTTFGPTLTKSALKSQGLSLWHLSRPTHGFSASRFATAILNPIRIRAENRFLAGRIVIQPGQTRRALEQVTNRLQANEAVSITIGTEASIVHTTPFLSGSMTVATRPLDLARQAQAKILPVVTLRDREGRYFTQIGRCLLKNAATDDEAICALAGFLEPHARRYPEQFAQSSVFWSTTVRPSPPVPAA